MAKLIFYDANHEYYVEENRLPSVSEVLRFISKEVYESLPQFRLENAGDRGTKVHKACEILDKYGEAEISVDIEPYLTAYIAFLDEVMPSWLEIEKPYHSEVFGFAGTIDRIGIVNGKKCVLDIKTNSQIKKPLVSAQLAGYTILAKEHGHEIETAYCLHLKNDGKYKLIELNEGAKLWESCYTLHKALETKKRTKKVKADVIESEEENE